VTLASEQRQALVEFRSAEQTVPRTSVTDETEAPATETPAKQKLFRLPLLRGKSRTPSLGKTRDERAEERERQKQQMATEAAEEAFFQTPAGRARLAYKRGHRLFQYELEINELRPTVIPGPVGSPARETTDPVDVLNSVTVEGWKLVTGKFIHSEMRHGAVGCYLFKRSQKRRLAMNNPWQCPVSE
jgi:hypothetical protein